MAIEGVIMNITEIPVPDTLIEISRIVSVLQAVGFVIILWVLFWVISLFLSYRKNRHLEKVVESVKALEEKMDKKLDGITRLIKSKKK